MEDSVLNFAHFILLKVNTFSDQTVTETSMNKHATEINSITLFDQYSFAYIERNYLA